MNSAAKKDDSYVAASSPMLGGALWDTTDEQLATAVAEADVPSMLAALALLTGDLDLLRPALKPDPNPLLDNAGLSAESLELGRQLAAATLQTIRDQRGRFDEPDRTIVEGVIGFLAGTSEELVAFLTEELSLGQDHGKPAWHADDVAGGADFPVVIIGAGMSGLLMTHRLRQAGIAVTVVEKEPDVGGTWLVNTYPGCRVDSPSHLYSYSFWESAQWPNFFSPQPVLLDYWRRFADDHGLRSHILFDTEVQKAAYDEEKQVWMVTVAGRDGQRRALRARAVISAVGQLNQPALPAIEGRDTFAGPSFHSARWDASADLTGKRVAVIGTGASSVQIVPAIAGGVEKLTVFQRSAPWLVPTPEYTTQFPDGLAWLLANVPYYAKLYRFWQFTQFIEGVLPYAAYDPAWTSPNPSGSELNDVLRAALTDYLELQLPDDPALRRRVTPDYPPITKRMLRDDGSWIAALKRDNVELVTDRIEEITKSGIIIDGRGEEPFDVIIYATGFTASDFLAPMTITGRAGVDLREHWNGDATAHLGITVPHFPNLFLMYGPNTNIVVNGSIIFFSECQAHYILTSIGHLLASGQTTMECRPEALEQFVADVDEANGRIVWGAPDAQNWYKNGRGRVSQNWPHSLLEYWRRTREPAVDDYLFH
jgi:4-hydroxyacetophenone monooxygenase